jgi:hypothetical protein
MKRYMKVPLDLSNRLRYDIKSPGNSTLEMGIHAHLRCTSGVMVGKSSMSGSSKSRITRLL